MQVFQLGLFLLSHSTTNGKVISGQKNKEFLPFRVHSQHRECTDLTWLHILSKFVQDVQLATNEPANCATSAVIASRIEPRPTAISPRRRAVEGAIAEKCRDPSLRQVENESVWHRHCSVWSDSY
jgi:hypothetical protein